jgi:glycosyltransferase involved in cell wall biosynthesis
VNILFDNVDWNSTAGPHWFGRKLASHLNQNGHGINTGNDDVQLSIVMASQKREGLPLIQRLDGIYYDTAKDYVQMNAPIKATYDVADGVVFQSEWSKKLVESQFGPAKKYAIINNGTDIDVIQSIPPATGLDDFDKVWSCASSWFYEDGTQRYIKRLEENIRYFQEHSGENDILCIAGDVRDFENPDDDKIVFLGELGLTELFSVYRRSDYFLHLGRFDNCPNVVVDARAAGCHIICSSLGGTVEVAGKDATVIVEDEWDFVPFECNVLSSLDFSRKMNNTYEKDISMDFVSDRYLEFFGELM